MEIPNTVSNRAAALLFCIPCSCAVLWGDEGWACHLGFLLSALAIPTAKLGGRLFFPSEASLFWPVVEGGLYLWAVFGSVFAPPGAVVVAIMALVGIQLAQAGRITPLQLLMFLALDLVLSRQSSLVSGGYSCLLPPFYWEPSMWTRATCGALALIAPTLLTRFCAEASEESDSRI